MAFNVGINSEGELQDEFAELWHGQNRYIIYKPNDTNTEFVVDKSGTSTDYYEFLEQLPESDARFAFYKFLDKVCLVTWAPDHSPQRSRMLVTSNRDSVQDSLVGLTDAEIMASELGDLDYKTVCSKIGASL